tara:strand:- start:176 stop:349 length:174 start_codon:yes stop_codon:yes gene_type:complete
MYKMSYIKEIIKMSKIDWTNWDNSIEDRKRQRRRKKRKSLREATKKKRREKYGKKKY